MYMYIYTRLWRILSRLNMRGLIGRLCTHIYGSKKFAGIPDAALDVIIIGRAVFGNGRSA